MRLGLIAYAENTGLGSQTKAYYDHLEPAYTMLLDRSAALDPRTFYGFRYRDCHTVHGLPDYEQVEEMVRACDIILMVETSPTQYLIKRARQKGVKTVMVPNYEYFHHFKHKGFALPDYLMSATLWHINDYPLPCSYLPYPVEASPVDKAVDSGYNFLHIAGKPIFPDRNGTHNVLSALEHVKAKVRVTIACQDPAYIDMLMPAAMARPDNVELVIRGPVEDWQENYQDQHVLLMPRRFGGLCLPVNEALGFGMPVIMPDVSPNNQWLPADWLVPARQMDVREMAAPIEVYESDTRALAAKIDELATKDGFAKARKQALALREEYSWERLKPRYIETLTAML